MRWLRSIIWIERRLLPSPGTLFGRTSFVSFVDNFLSRPTSLNLCLAAIAQAPSLRRSRKVSRWCNRSSRTEQYAQAKKSYSNREPAIVDRCVSSTSLPRGLMQSPTVISRPCQACV